MQRPTGVTVIAVINFIGAGLLVFGALAAFFGGAFIGAIIGGGASHSGMGAGMGMLIGGVLGAVLLVFAAISGVVGWGLWGLKEWARIVQIVFAALAVLFRTLSLLLALSQGRIFGLPLALVLLAYNAWVIWYLIQPHVRVAFVRPAAPAYAPPAPPVS
ncbi:MAG TPA: hypothetical protein VF135_09430 [Terriglobales bacterium]